MLLPYVIMRTGGFIADIEPDLQAKIMEYALKHIRPQKPNWVVFYPENKQPNHCSKCKSGKPHYEDEGRTLIVPNFQGLTQKIYVILDDFGSVEALKENMGKYAPPDLNTKYVVTFLLAEEY